MKKKLFIIILLSMVSIFGFCDDELGYSSTITEPFSTNIYGESVSQQSMMLMSMPIDPGEPIPDPVQTPIEDLPFVFLLILLGTYSIYKIKNRKI